MAAKVIGQLMDAGHMQQDSQNTVLLNTANGIQRFGTVGQEPEVQIDFEDDGTGGDMEDGGLKKEWTVDVGYQ